MKPFYRDSLLDLRQIIYAVYQRALRTSSFYPQKPAPELQQNSFYDGNRSFKKKFKGDDNDILHKNSSNNKYYRVNQIPRVIIVTRNLTGIRE